MTEDPGPTLDEIHLTLDINDDLAVYEPDGTVVIAEFGIRHRCPPGTTCAEVVAERMAET